jgi:transcriptional regulator with XRE-family HTH domain
MTKPTTLLEPKLLAFWVRCIREGQHMSQDALAAVSGVDIRTIQRMEAGNVVSITTRRCIARGLGYENADAFDDPKFGLEVHQFLEGMQAIRQKAFERQYPDRVRVKVERVLNGESLGRFADALNAVSLNADDNLSSEVKRAAAAMFDYVRDLLDVGNDASFTDKLSFNQELETMLRELEGLGAAVYSAIRSTKIASDNWTNKTPIPLAIGYLTAVPKERIIEEMLVSRRLGTM